MEALGDGRFRAGLVKDWWVGRGPNGGYLAAIIMRALQEVAPADRPPRSLTIHFLRPPAEGEVEIAVTTERSGSAATFLSARMEQDGRTQALILAAFSAEWTGPSFDNTTMPDVPGPDAELVQLDPETMDVPPFFHNYRALPAVGTPPFSGGTEAITGGWIGAREPHVLDAPLAVAILDAWIPAPFIVLDDFAAAPTIDYTVHFRVPLPQPGASPDDLHLSVFRSNLSHDGFFEEDGELWSAGGMLLAQSRQLALLLELPIG